MANILAVCLIFLAFDSSFAEMSQATVKSFESPPTQLFGNIINETNPVLLVLALAHFLLFFFLFRVTVGDIARTKWTCPKYFVASGFTAHRPAWLVSYDGQPPLVEFDGESKVFYLNPDLPSGVKPNPILEVLSVTPKEHNELPYLTGYRISEVNVRTSDFDFAHVQPGDYLVAAQCEPINIGIDTFTSTAKAAERLNKLYTTLITYRPFSIQVLRPIDKKGLETQQVWKKNYVQFAANMQALSGPEFISSTPFLWGLFGMGCLIAVVPLAAIFKSSNIIGKLENLKLEYYFAAVAMVMTMLILVQLIRTSKAEIAFRVPKKFMYFIFLLVLAIVIGLSALCIQFGRKADTNEENQQQMALNYTWSFFNFSLSILFLAFNVFKAIKAKLRLRGPMLVEDSTADIMAGLISTFESAFSVYSLGRSSAANGGTCFVDQLQERLVEFWPLTMPKRADCSNIQFDDSKGRPVIPDGLKCTVWCGNTPRRVVCGIFGLDGAVWDLIMFKTQQSFCCAHCPIDSFVNKKCTRFEDTQCSTCKICPAGTFTKEICSGLQETDTKTCEPCAGLTYQDQTNQRSCKACPQGQIPNGTKTACIPQ